MNNAPPEAASEIVQFGVVVLLTACIVLWGQMLYRISRGLPVLPYVPRRPVPWKLIDLLGILLIFLVLFGWLSVVLLPPERKGQRPGDAVQPAVEAREKAANGNAVEGKTEDLSHPVIVILRRSPNLGTLLTCVWVAVVVAPVAEEIMFRLLLQGWLEAVERRHRRWNRIWRRVSPGLVPIVVVSAIFAAAHYRTERPEPDIESLLHLFSLDATAKIVALVVGITWIWRFRGATLVDFGLVPGKFWEDIRLGFLAYLPWVPPVLIIQVVATALLPGWLAADPIALFVFAVALGSLYYRTHRIVPAIVVHMALNATSLAAAWLLMAT